MGLKAYPVIDLAATGDNIRRLRMARGLTARDLQSYFGSPSCGRQAVLDFDEKRKIMCDLLSRAQRPGVTCHRVVSVCNCAALSFICT